MENYLNGGNWRLVRGVVECRERQAQRPPQAGRGAQALPPAQATLVIAKLDRLAGDVHFISGLMKSGVEFVCVDMPESNKLTLHIMAAMAEHEAETISKRTKEALTAARTRGVKLGGRRTTPERHEEISTMARAARTRKRLESEWRYRPLIDQIRAHGAETLREIAKELNRRGEETARRTATQVHRMLKHT